MDNRTSFKKGIRDGIPIGLGYFAVAFSLGIAASSVGLTAFQAMLASALNNASAGEFAAFTLIGAGATYAEVALMTLVTNARYLLMSCALSQKLSPDCPLLPRMIVGFNVTDEVFGISIAWPGQLNPYYNYGAMLMTIPGWASGTFLGVVMGNVLPVRLVNALSVALYGMFIATIVPPARRDRVIALLIAASMVLSWAASLLLERWSLLSGLTGGMRVSLRVILLTVGLSAFAAWRFPRKEEAA